MALHRDSDLNDPPPVVGKSNELKFGLTTRSLVSLAGLLHSSWLLEPGGQVLK